MFRSMAICVMLAMVALLQVANAWPDPVNGDVLKDQLKRREESNLMDELLERLRDLKYSKREEDCFTPLFSEGDACYFDLGDESYGLVSYGNNDLRVQVDDSDGKRLLQYQKNEVSEEDLAGLLPLTVPDTFEWNSKTYKVKVPNIVPGTELTVEKMCLEEQ